MLVAEIQPDYQIALVERPTPVLPEQGALVRMTGCGLCGSDLDKVVNRKASPGSVLGHEVVGVVEALADGHGTAFSVGDRIVTAHHVPCGTCHYCLNDSQSMCRQFKQSNLFPGGFSQQIALTWGHLQHTAFKIPDDVSDTEASCVEPLACVLRAVKRSEVAHGGPYTNGSVLVIGLGFIGLLAAQLYKQRGYQVFGTDLLAGRLELSKKERMVDDAFNPTTQESDLAEALQRNTELGKVDLVFLTVVNAATLALAMQTIRDGGTMVVFASGPPNALLNPSNLYFREVNLISSYSPSLENLRESATLVFSRTLNFAPLITHHLPLSRLGEAMELYRSGRALKVLIEP